MIELKISTKRGKKVYEMGKRCHAYALDELYIKPSQAKLNAYYECIRMFSMTNNSYHFRVGNANTFSFTATWLGDINGETIMRVETKDSSYLIWLNR